MCARAEKVFENCSHFCIFHVAWDQSEKFVKIYLTLKDVHKIPSENVEVNFTEGYGDNRHIYTLYIHVHSVYFSPRVTNHTIIFVHSLFCSSFSVLVKDLDGKNHQLTVLNLLYPINEKDSYKKVNKASSSVDDQCFLIELSYLLVVHRQTEELLISRNWNWAN